MNRSSSTIGMRTWRSTLIGLIKPRWIKRRTDTGDIPKYLAASLNFTTRGVTLEKLELVVIMLHNMRPSLQVLQD
jgi:hypothetical protein